jgi:LCP family protein required for cell wall assembly
VKNERKRPGRTALATALALLLALLATPAGAAQGDPADARVAPVTPKPWLAPAATEAADVPDGVAPTPAPTRAPSSLDILEADESLAATPAPTSVALPEGLDGNGTVFRVLLIGTDAYTVNQTGRSDTMILAQVDVATGEIKLVSFLRDLYVKIPNHGKTRLNAAYVYGGASLLTQTLQNNFGVSADRTVAVNFSLMVTLIDRLGGVTVDVSEKERKQVNSILRFYNEKNGWPEDDELLYDSGNQLLTGKQALCYSRIRKIDSDFQRVGRQRKVLTALYQKARETTPLTRISIALDLLPQVKTDLTAADAAALIPLMLRLDTVTVTGLTVPVDGGYESQTISGMSVLVPYLEKNQRAVDAFLR